VELLLEEEPRAIEIAWEDGTPFEAIEHQFWTQEPAVVKSMQSR
jgi:uncharacterized protein (TIGR03643 family)